jgi:hypothetical protein
MNLIGEGHKSLSMNMNVGNARKDSKFCKRWIRITAIFGVPNVKLICLTGFYLFSALALLNQMGVVQPGPPERPVRRGRVPLTGI